MTLFNPTYQIKDVQMDSERRKKEESEEIGEKGRWEMQKWANQGF